MKRNKTPEVIAVNQGEIQAVGDTNSLTVNKVALVSTSGACLAQVNRRFLVGKNWHVFAIHVFDVSYDIFAEEKASTLGNVGTWKVHTVVRRFDVGLLDFVNDLARKVVMKIVDC